MLSAFLVPFERAFMFQVTEQHSKLSAALRDHGSYLASNGWTVRKENAPEIDLKGKTIYLRGDNGDKDLWPSRVWDLSNNWNRDKYLGQINDALQEFVSFASKKAELYERDIYGCYSAEALCSFAYVKDPVITGTVKTTPKTNKVSHKPTIAA